MATAQELKRIQQGPRNLQERIWWDRYSPEHLQQWRYVCDPLADACIGAIGRTQPSGMLQQVEQLALAGNADCQRFLAHCHRVPSWVDFDVMETGRRVYARYAPLQAIVLLCSSLVEGYTIEKAVKVLVQTGRLQKDVSRRIFETGQMLHNIAAPDGLRPGGIGHRTLMEVRLLHSAVRYWISRSGQWDEARYEKPINQEDMAATLLGFDFMVVRGMQKLGLRLTAQERSAMHYFWRYAGYVLGVDEALLTESWQEQEILAFQVHRHLYNPTPDGELLAKHLLRDMANKPPFYFSLPVLYSFTRYLIGSSVADAFHIRSSVPGWLAVRAVKTAVLGASYGNRLMPDVALRIFEKVSLQLGRGALQLGLGDDPARWGFKSMA